MLSQRKRTTRVGRALLIGALAFATTLVGLVAPSPAVKPAQAASFNAGNIISDSLFYNGNAMSAAQVQNFLDGKVRGGSCTIGQSGRKPGDPAYWGGPTVFAPACLNGYRMNTISVGTNAYCTAYTGKNNETAAEIIAKVGQACGVSQQTLLVTLEKEQSLVTDEWPTEKQFAIATGYGCPDSGANWSANCDSRYFGLQIQVYNAAWQFRHYSNPDIGFNFKAGQTANIQWNPNPSCGTSQVYIENWATAALYNYTPYRPNQAALNAGWGTGDSCSSYGNRNFHQLFNSWFPDASDSSPAPSPALAIDARLQSAYSESGGQNGSFGAPLSVARSLGEGAVEQRFASGNLYWSDANGVSSTRGAIRALYEANGGPTGVYGLPVGNEVNENGWVRQEFRSGTAFWTSASGAGLIRGGIRTQYLAHSGEGGLSGTGGYLGLPIGVEAPVDGGVAQTFERGVMYWTPEILETWTRGGIAGEHNRLQGAAGRLGFPLSSETSELGYAVQNFERGKIYWTPEVGANAVFGAIYQQHEAQGGAQGFFGLPRTSEIALSSGVRQEFDSVTAYWRSETGVGYVFGGIRSAYHAEGGASGYLGFPIAGEVTQDSWARQSFEHGSAYWSAETSTVFTRGAIHDAYLQSGGYEGRYGYPLTSEVSEHGGVRQEYQNNATAYWSSASGAGFVRGGIGSTYKSLGGPASFLGFPVGEEVTTGDWARQEFQRGILYWSQQTGVVVVRGAIRDEFIAQGAAFGDWGYPLTSEIQESAGVRQEYQKVTVRWTSAEGVVVTRKG